MKLYGQNVSRTYGSQIDNKNVIVYETKQSIVKKHGGVVNVPLTVDQAMTIIRNAFILRNNTYRPFRLNIRGINNYRYTRSILSNAVVTLLTAGTITFEDATYFETEISLLPPLVIKKENKDPRDYHNRR